MLRMMSFVAKKQKKIENDAIVEGKKKEKVKKDKKKAKKEQVGLVLKVHQIIKI